MRSVSKRFFFNLQEIMAKRLIFAVFRQIYNIIYFGIKVKI